jgi:DNA repair protein RadC
MSGQDYGGAAFRYSLTREGADPLPAESPEINSPAAAARFFRTVEPGDGREHFRVAFLDQRRRLAGWFTVSVGCLSASLVHPREVFGPALVSGAASLILTHNHPSGDPEPSAEDLALTRRLKAGGDLLGLEVCDHVITGDGTGRWVSLQERGAL